MPQYLSVHAWVHPCLVWACHLLYPPIAACAANPDQWECPAVSRRQDNVIRRQDRTRFPCLVHRHSSQPNPSPSLLSQAGSNGGPWEPREINRNFQFSKQFSGGGGGGEVFCPVVNIALLSPSILKVQGRSWVRTPDWRLEYRKQSQQHFPYVSLRNKYQKKNQNECN